MRSTTRSAPIRIEPEPYCGVYWIITTCLTALAIGAGLGVLLWLVLS